MKKLIALVGACIAQVGNKALQHIALFAFFLMLASTARADAGALETAALAGVTSAKTAGENVLIAVFGILVGFVIFKLIRKAMNKA